MEQFDIKHYTEIFNLPKQGCTVVLTYKLIRELNGLPKRNSFFI